MSMSSGSAADYLVDRRRMRRKLTFWRVLAGVVVVLAIVALAAKGRMAFADRVTPHIARVKIGGLITGDDETLRLLHDAETSAASALILQIESPGGTTVGSERVYDAIRRVAAKKPVVATVDTLAASGAYIAALAPTTSWPTAIRSSARSACCSSFPTCRACSTRSASRSKR